MSCLFTIMALTLLISNVNGLHDPDKWAEVWHTVPPNDVLCFQETHLTVKQERAFSLCAQGYNF